MAMYTQTCECFDLIYALQENQTPQNEVVAMMMMNQQIFHQFMLEVIGKSFPRVRRFEHFL